MMYRIIVLHNDGTQENRAVQAPSFADLAIEVAGRRIKSFTVTLA